MNYNPTEDHTNLICNTLDEFRNDYEVNEDIVEGLKPTEPKTTVATVIVDTKDYVKEANRQLQDAQYYWQLNYNPTEDHTNLICNNLDEFRNDYEVNEDIVEGLKPTEPKTTVATVIVDTKDYVKEANRQLQDAQYYWQLNYNPTEDHANLI